LQAYRLVWGLPPMQTGLKVVRTNMIMILLWKNVIMSVSELKITVRIIGESVTPTGI